MLSKTLEDRDSVLSIGLLFFALSLAAQGMGDGEPIWKFVQGVMVGISIGAFALSIVLSVASKRGRAS